MAILQLDYIHYTGQFTVYQVWCFDDKYRASRWSNVKSLFRKI